MIHLGDITKINGAEIAPVDVITGGSPCQDLSVAGKRAGLDGERSGLFMDQIRIVKEMREADEQRGRTGHFIRPRFVVWENVPGAFSSNGGRDFQAVLTEFARVAEPNAPDVPMPPSGRWSKSGCIYDELGKWSVAWRVHDAQFWGVPQRRKRIALVADFGGLAAPEILFERASVSRDIEQSGAQGQRTSTGVKNSVGTASERVYCLQGNGIDRADTAGCNGKGVKEGTSYTLNTIDRPAVAAFSFQERAGKPGGGKGILIQNDRVGALSTLNNQAVAVFRKVSRAKSAEDAETWEQADIANTLNCFDIGDVRSTTLACDVYNGAITGEVAASLTCASGIQNATGRNAPLIFEPRSQDGVPRIHDGISPTLNTAQGGQRQPCVMAIYTTSKNSYHTRAAENVANSLVATDYKDPPTVYATQTVRRLTPLECERLQGFPDGWTDIGEWTDSKGKKRQCTDGARYKALGNSIALPFWKALAKRISAQYDRDITLGSLFDGIGGFPLVFEQINGKGAARWASEIEEFPIAVTKCHFGEE